MDAAEGNPKPASEAIQKLQKLVMKDSGGAPTARNASGEPRRETPDLLCRALLDPQGPPLSQAIRLAHRMREETPDLGLRLLRCAAEMRESGTDPDPRRLLTLLCQAQGEVRVAYALMPYMRSADPQVRSKAALLIARSGLNPEWALRQLKDPDPRVRANVIEGIGSSPEPRRFLEALRQAARDRHHRVATTALIALFRLGEESAADALREMASHPDSRFRAAAAWAMGQIGAAQFEPVLQTLRRDPHHAVRFCALRALVRHKGRRAS